MTKSLSDDEWLKVQDDLGNFLNELREENEVRKETDELVVFADHQNNELDAIAEANGVSRDSLSARMHSEVRMRYSSDDAGDPWSVADPIIVYKEV